MKNTSKYRTQGMDPEVLSPLMKGYDKIFKSGNNGNRHLAIVNADALQTLKQLPGESIQCVVTSPPYYGQRDYGVAGQIGREKTLDEYIADLVAVFAEVYRALHPSGTLWLNLGDAYANSSTAKKMGLKSKNLALIPSRVAIALQEQGWYLRSDIAWFKKTPMPESVKDRPTNAWEHVFLFAKSPKYFYNAEAVNEQSTGSRRPRKFGKVGNGDRNDQDRYYTYNPTRNMRNVMRLAHDPYPGAHFAPFPSAIPRTAIKAGTSEKGCCPICFNPWMRDEKKGDGRWEPTCDCGYDETLPCIVLDPFGGSGTTGKVAMELGRRAILTELNPAYCDLAKEICGDIKNRNKA